MSEEKQPKPLTPEQQAKSFEQAQQEAQKNIHGQFAATDFMERATDLMDGFFRGGRAGDSVFGKTSFENAKLNAMLDFLDSANPADLENASATLKKATNALNDAAKDLAAAVAAPDWKGEGAEAFRSYGAQIVSYTYKLSNFANVVGAQMEVASTGLASVRNSKPPRDGRLIQKSPEEFALPERTEDNQEYQKALAVEKDRQEAINQMNRLASFYAVSHSTLAAQDPPPPPKPLNAAVPAPLGQFDARSSGTGSEPARLSEASSPQPGGRSEAGTGGGSARAEVLGRPGEIAGPHTSVQIDSVLTPTAPTAPTNTPPLPSQPTTPGPTPGTPPPVLTNLGPSRPNPARAQGMPGTPRTGAGKTGPVGRPSTTGYGNAQPTGRNAPAVGRPAPTSGPATSTGRSGPPVGRPGTPGTGPTVGRPGTPGTGPAVGRPGTPGTGPGTGRAGVPGGNGPVTGRPGVPGQVTPGRQNTSSTPRAGHSNGIVGGTPQRGAQGANGTAGSRLPRATVIGGEGPATGRPPVAKPSHSGVIGAGQGSGTRATGRGTPSANGVVGMPRGTTASPGRAGQRQNRDEEQDQTGSARPGHLTEDEETWAGRRRGAVPPVIG
ncbi:hypothetical protein E2C00_34130 [Streptomyces sp. WAC05374]|uniref:hypothetical protein n=1 Tax=Streptomyces sp. WAC05374 TaxID=2487420 RepID=UPI0010563BD8|nr:hypothetical protein [Streptomyces sp. WAC05374]TDF36027.1 hypothetical protein E2B92_31680 [Streptomyces sp. WAC05374]TDF45484.1 hypothetical protein E2C02_33710 [Streptomyces sp. WAC05374]TDF46402.1 hypothetical protein E2C00_34130 [Streptomyces sp. WAC05374]